MKFTVDSGLWALGSEVDAPPEVAVLEVSGAVLAWTIHDAAQAVRITFTDLNAADWLWQLVGEAGHVAVVAAAEATAEATEATEAGDEVDLELLTEPLAALRRLAVGHWLRRWWPASVRDGIMPLDAAVLDAEVARNTLEVNFFSVLRVTDRLLPLLRPGGRIVMLTSGLGDTSDLPARLRGRLGRRGVHLCALGTERVGLDPRAVPDVHRVPGLAKTSRHGKAHVSEA